MGSIDTDDSDIDCSEIQFNDRAVASSSHRTRRSVRQVDEAHKKETVLRFTLYAFIKDSIVSNFTKKQLRNKISKLNKRFTDNLAKSGDSKGSSFTNSNDGEMFKLSMIIWGKKNETECDTNVNMDQGKDLALVENEQNNESVEHKQMIENVEQGKEDLTNVEHAKINENVAQEEDATYVEDEQITENMAQEEKDLTNVEQGQSNENVEQGQSNENVEQAEDVTHVEREQINENVEQGKVDDGEKVSEEEFCVLQDAFETTLFPKLGQATSDGLDLILETMWLYTKIISSKNKISFS